MDEVGSERAVRGWGGRLPVVAVVMVVKFFFFSLFCCGLLVVLFLWFFGVLGCIFGSLGGLGG